MEVKFYDKVEDSLLKFTVILAKYQGKWVFCKHKERDTYELPDNWTYPLIYPRIFEETEKRNGL